MTESLNAVTYMMGLAESKGLELDVGTDGELLIRHSARASSVVLHNLLELKLWIVPVLLVKRALAESAGGLLFHQLQSKAGLSDDDFRFAVRTLVEEGELACSDAGVWTLGEEVN